MLKCIFVLLFAVTTSAFAADCVNEKGEDITSQPEVFQALIEKSTECYQAKALAEACAYGSSIDVISAGLAYSVCEKKLNENKPAKKLTAMLTTMKKMCSDKYAKQQGTMYRSMNAYCNLTSIDWILGLASE